MLKRLYDFIMRFSESPHARPVLLAVSFFESSIFPLPPDPLFIAMALRDKRQIWSLALLLTISSVAGGLLGYAIGWAFFQTLGQQIIAAYGLETNFHLFQEQFQKWGFWIIIAKGVTPIPYKLVTIACGLIQLYLPTFIFASLLARGLRFFFLAAVLWRFGEKMKELIERYLTILTIIFFFLLIAGVLVFKII